MSDEELVRAAARPVLADITSTTGLHIDLSPWHGDEASIGYVLHEAGVDPATPVWEAYQLLSGGDGLAMHPPRFGGDPRYRDDLADVTATVADTAQQLVQVLLWQRGLDPAWPPCPAHGGRHPFRILGRETATSMRDGERVVHEDTGSAWVCPARAAIVPFAALYAVAGPS